MDDRRDHRRLRDPGRIVRRRGARRRRPAGWSAEHPPKPTVISSRSGPGTSGPVWTRSTRTHGSDSSESTGTSLSQIGIIRHCRQGSGSTPKCASLNPFGRSSGRGVSHDLERIRSGEADRENPHGRRRDPPRHVEPGLLDADGPVTVLGGSDHHSAVVREPHLDIAKGSGFVARRHAVAIDVQEDASFQDRAIGFSREARDGRERERAWRGQLQHPLDRCRFLTRGEDAVFAECPGVVVPPAIRVDLVVVGVERIDGIGGEVAETDARRRVEIRARGVADTHGRLQLVHRRVEAERVCDEVDLDPDRRPDRRPRCAGGRDRRHRNCRRTRLRGRRDRGRARRDRTSSPRRSGGRPTGRRHAWATTGIEGVIQPAKSSSCRSRTAAKRSRATQSASVAAGPIRSCPTNAGLAIQPEQGPCEQRHEEPAQSGVELYEPHRSPEGQENHRGHGQQNQPPAVQTPLRIDGFVPSPRPLLERFREEKRHALPHPDQAGQHRAPHPDEEYEANRGTESGPVAGCLADRVSTCDEALRTRWQVLQRSQYGGRKHQHRDPEDPRERVADARGPRAHHPSGCHRASPFRGSSSRS